MDNHPIPQDVTHFQFKLIGEMTLKQFGYVAAGCIMAYIFINLPIHFLIKFPLAAIYAGAGAIFAFIPIEGRPADTMVKQFVKALFSSTQYLYHKESADQTLSALLEGTINTQSLSMTKVKPAPAPQTQQTQPAAILQTRKTSTQTIPQPPPQTITPQPNAAITQLYTNPRVQPIKPMPLDAPEQREMTQYQAAPSAAPQAVIAQKSKTLITPTPQFVLPQQQEETPAQTEEPNAKIPVNPNLDKEEKELEKEADTLTSALEQAKTAEKQQQGTPGYEQAHQKALELEEELQRTAAQKQRLEQELIQLRQQLAQPQQVYSPTTAVPQQQTEHVRRIPKEMQAGVGLPNMPDVPNLITGIVKDSRENVLPNILIEVKDAEGNPVRAFKTNQLGQFASATPILNGTYTIHFEDPGGKHKFETVEITAEGEVLLPIEIISIDQREELRKELFG